MRVTMLPEYHRQMDFRNHNIKESQQKCRLRVVINKFHLGRSCSLCVSLVNKYQIVCVLLSLLFLRVGCVI